MRGFLFNYSSILPKSTDTNLALNSLKPERKKIPAPRVELGISRVLLNFRLFRFHGFPRIWNLHPR